MVYNYDVGCVFVLFSFDPGHSKSQIGAFLCVYEIVYHFGLLVMVLERKSATYCEELMSIPAIILPMLAQGSDTLTLLAA